VTLQSALPVLTSNLRTSVCAIGW